MRWYGSSSASSASLSYAICASWRESCSNAALSEPQAAESSPARLAFFGVGGGGAPFFFEGRRPRNTAGGGGRGAATAALPNTASDGAGAGAGAVDDDDDEERAEPEGGEMANLLSG